MACIHMTRVMKHLRKINYLRLTIGQLVLIVLLAAALGLLLSFLTMRTEFTANSRVMFTHGGFPLEAIKLRIAKVGYYYEVAIEEYFWNEIVLNVIIYMVSSIIIVKLAIWIRDETKSELIPSRALCFLRRCIRRCSLRKDRAD